MAKKKRGKRKRTTSEMVMLVLGILIALSMILSLFVGLGRSSSQGSAPLPPDQLYKYEDSGRPISALSSGQAELIPGIPSFLVGNRLRT